MYKGKSDTIILIKRSLVMASSNYKKKINNLLGSRKRKIMWGVGVVLLLFILIGVFGAPSAKTVFKDMNEEMLKTKSVTINQVYKGGSGGDTMSLDSKMSLDLTSSKELSARGTFTLDLTSSGSPMAVGADVVAIGKDSYIKFNTLSSSSPALSDSFDQVESKLKSKWVKAREGDNFASFAKMPIDSMTDVLPTPFANLNDIQRKNVLTILQDKSTYTINESSKVEINGVSAYKYSLSFNKDQINKAAKAITGYVDYFKNSTSDDSVTKSFTVWVNISTKRVIKMEVKGTSKGADIEGTITFSDYNKSVGVVKPSDYSIESELLN